ncbi:PBECR2 nuclease fold domain-containing protein [Calidithermus roseus]|nr:PBECR2 nuclease fold domain-containing protein [Calidithermus roseus]
MGIACGLERLKLSPVGPRVVQRAHQALSREISRAVLLLQCDGQPIPACAGNTQWGSGSLAAGTGSSPRARGTPWWERNWPPLHFNCRSGVRALTELEAEQRGIAERLPEEPPREGFGLSPDASEWGRAYARGVTAQTLPDQWEPAFLGSPPNWRSYGRPERLPAHPAPAPLLPTVKEAGEKFRKALETAWGGLPLYVQDPTGMTVILDDAFLRHIKPDGRERFLSWLPDLVSDPEEVWLVPMRKVNGRTVAFRLRYVKLYQDERQRNVLFVGEFQKGVLVGGYTFVETRDQKYFNRQRQGFLRFK